MSTNDTRVMELKKQVAEKKKLVAKAVKFSPCTNCSIELDGVRHNLNVLNREQLIGLIVKLNSYAMSACELGLLKEFNISGYNVMDWITDIKAKLNVLIQKEEENKLKALESKLHQLLSSDKKIELEIDAIMEELK